MSSLVLTLSVDGVGWVNGGNISFDSSYYLIDAPKNFASARAARYVRIWEEAPYLTYHTRWTVRRVVAFSLLPRARARADGLRGCAPAAAGALRRDQ